MLPPRLQIFPFICELLPCVFFCFFLKGLDFMIVSYKKDSQQMIFYQASLDLQKSGVGRITSYDGTVRRN